MNRVENKINPFLRWAGGKRWLIRHSTDIVPTGGYRNYFEPFLGGGAFFFHVNPINAVLSDLNKELIETYQAIKEIPTPVVNILATYENTETFYYSLRESSPVSFEERAARFIYLNQTSFNGIYRVNLKGQYNVPYGYRTKEFLDEDLLFSVSERLQNCELFHGDFMSIKNRIKENDLIFLDPPYTVSHNNNGFIKYNQKLFSLEDQYRLSELIDHIKEVNAFYILTNAAHHKVEEIFSKGDRMLEKRRSNLIGGDKAIRGHTTEFVFTNTY